MLRALGLQALAQNDGARAEAIAARHLQRHGARIIARNVRCRGGEIDLVAEHADSIVFVEVRLRQHGDYGGAAASITNIKQRRVIKAARVWLAGSGRAYATRNCRFDAMLLKDLKGEVEWLQAAFSA